MSKYIDIHTHHTPKDDNILAVKNHILGLDAVEHHDFFSIGIHPWYIHEAESLFTIIEETVKKKKCIAIGECGLDLTPNILKKNDLNHQQIIFLSQARLAEQHRKPLIIHCVKCYDRLLSIKKNFMPQSAWIIHGFSKNTCLARQLIEAGFYLSFGAQLFKSVKNRKALENLPLNRVFLETDDQTDYDIKHIYQKVAEIKNISTEKLQKQILNNFKQVVSMS